MVEDSPRVWLKWVDVQVEGANIISHTLSQSEKRCLKWNVSQCEKVETSPPQTNCKRTNKEVLAGVQLWNCQPGPD